MALVKDVRLNTLISLYFQKKKNPQKWKRDLWYQREQNKDNHTIMETGEQMGEQWLSYKTDGS